MLAREMDIPVAFDVNLRRHLWESVETARKTIEPMLDISTIVKLSDDELSPVLKAEDAEEGAKILLDRGVSLVLISMGGEGAFYATRGFDGNLPRFEIDKVVDATGAGDAFLAATLAHLSKCSGWLSNESVLREAVRRGTAAGALACTDYGAMRALPTGEELERFMAVRN
jgi:fructokinase